MIIAEVEGIRSGLRSWRDVPGEIGIVGVLLRSYTKPLCRLDITIVELIFYRSN